MSDQGMWLSATAAAIGCFHTLIGPDHYLPFLAIARARSWSLARTLVVTMACGTGHVLGSILLGALGIGLGWTLGSLEWLEAVRGEVAAWLLLGFGMAYTAWGLRQAARNRPHAHWHVHAGGSGHLHEHRHVAQHAHVHFETAKSSPGRSSDVTPWILFIIFVFGPCEALIPLLMFPAAAGSWWTIGLVCLIFGVCTVGTMTLLVGVGYLGLSRLAFGRLERYSHALAGLAIFACGAAIRLGL